MIAIRCTRAKAFHSTVSINQERKLGDRRRSDTVVVLTINDVNQGLDEIQMYKDEEAFGAWPFLVGGVICQVNSGNERD
ncbi:hypothetical protein ENUP19_0390G0001 [Entamoeba nuttalli]|uniref:Uncharacterized protein n=1 Tax=Entamoeba nuttalli TaxID=412467 RepID=A0ABQ0DZL8_9EUKA